MSDREQLEEIVARGDPVEWLNVLQHEATRANNAEERADYLQREINKMRRVMQEAGTWDQFCRDYGAAFPVGVPVAEPPREEFSSGRRAAQQAQDETKAGEWDE